MIEVTIPEAGGQWVRDDDGEVCGFTWDFADYQWFLPLLVVI